MNPEQAQPPYPDRDFRDWKGGKTPFRPTLSSPPTIDELRAYHQWLSRPHEMKSAPPPLPPRADARSARAGEPSDGNLLLRSLPEGVRSEEEFLEKANGEDPWADSWEAAASKLASCDLRDASAATAPHQEKSVLAARKSAHAGQWLAAVSIVALTALGLWTAPAEMAVTAPGNRTPAQAGAAVTVRAFKPVIPDQRARPEAIHQTEPRRLDYDPPRLEPPAPPPVESGEERSCLRGDQPPRFEPPATPPARSGEERSRLREDVPPSLLGLAPPPAQSTEAASPPKPPDVPDARSSGSMPAPFSDLPPSVRAAIERGENGLFRVPGENGQPARLYDLGAQRMRLFAPRRTGR